MTTIESFDRVIEFVAQTTDIPISIAVREASALAEDGEQASISRSGGAIRSLFGFL
jgi:hypothetical protein